MRLLKNKSSERKPPKTAASTSEPSVVCTASHKQNYWPVNSPKNTQIPTKQISTWHLETRQKTDTVYPGCPWLRREIHQQRTWTTSQERTRRTLQTYMWLDGQMVYRDNIGLGLQQTPGSSIHAKLHAESFETIPTQSRQATACTISKCTNPIWCKETIHNTRIEGATGRWQS